MGEIGCIAVVQVLDWNNHSLTLEKIEAAPTTLKFWRRFGRELAELHERRWPHFGFDFDNHIGPTPQLNPKRATSEISWGEYFMRHRLETLLAQPRLKKVGRLQELYVKHSDRILAELLQVKEAPSLVHGDLWSGNFICYRNTVDELQPVLIDPAPYWGHREVDLAMTELFGGFAPDFYTAYAERLPLEAGYPGRKDIYNLYHLLNHWLIFGDSYSSQTLRLFERL